MKCQMVVTLLALIVSAGCNGSDVTGSMNPGGAARSSALGALSEGENLSSPRSGQLIVRKECHLYTGKAGDICTITQSNLEAIPVGSVITYARDAGDGSLDSDVVLDPPGPGRSVAYGHCSLSL